MRPVRVPLLEQGRIRPAVFEQVFMVAQHDLPDRVGCLIIVLSAATAGAMRHLHAPQGIVQARLVLHIWLCSVRRLIEKPGFQLDIVFRWRSIGSSIIFKLGRIWQMVEQEIYEADDEQQGPFAHTRRRSKGAPSVRGSRVTFTALGIAQHRGVRSIGADHGEAHGVCLCRCQDTARVNGQE